MALAPFELTVVMYHYVRDPGDAAEAGSGIGGLPVSAFEAQLDWLARRFDVVGWPAVRAHLLGQQALPPGACLLTFDDGVCDHYLNVFPRLRARGLPGLFFAMARPAGAGLTLPHQLHFLLAALGHDRLAESLKAALSSGARERLAAAIDRYLAGALRFTRDDPVEAFKAALQRELAGEAAPALEALFERHIGPGPDAAAAYYLSAAQVAEMAAGGMHFGGHSASHPWLDCLDDAAVVREAEASAAWLAEVTPGPWAFAYPYGGYDERTPRSLEAAGFCAAFTTRPQVTHASAFHIGRLDGEALPPVGEAEAAWLPAGSRHA